jgi:hypothetical protein
LELIYPGKHILKITSEDDVFIVDLKIGLEKRSSIKEVLPKLTPVNAEA